MMKRFLSLTAAIALAACNPPEPTSTVASSDIVASTLLPAPDLLPVPASGASMASVATAPMLVDVFVASAASVVYSDNPIQAAASSVASAPQLIDVQTKIPPTSASAPQSTFQQIPKDPAAAQLIHQAEQQTSGQTRAILQQAREMTLQRQEIIQGGCWDYLDTAWTRAGVPREARRVVYADKIDGQYAPSDRLQAGDWIYHVNYSYNNIGHSGMFIGWVDKSKNLGLTLSYAGENRLEPARYRVYDLSGVYQITRAKE